MSIPDEEIHGLFFPMPTFYSEEEPENQSQDEAIRDIIEHVEVIEAEVEIVRAALEDIIGEGI